MIQHDKVKKKKSKGQTEGKKLWANVMARVIM
jgi:hypothetical protein